VIDGATNNVIMTIPVGEFPRALVYNRTNNKVYCSNSQSCNITVIDGATDSVITTIPGVASRSLVYNPINNKVYCTNNLSDNVIAIDGATDSVIATIAVGEYPYALLYNPTNNKIYSANYFSDDVTVIDGATDSVIVTIPVGYLSEPWALTWNPVQNRTYVANRNTNNVSVILDVMGMEENSCVPVERDVITATLFSRPLQLSEDKKCRVCDITGRVVEPTNIAPGIYFLEVDNKIVQKVVKVR
jgi:YVTN family beta-propeller protein